MSTALSLEGIEKQPLSSFTEQAYLDYSMYVILDRALPHLADGLKPVQRRIIYAMSELALGADAKFKKSARTIGDVLGKFHPHGDTACYEAMVLMAQPFSYRYPFVDGQGNWGSLDDPKSFAAMRYTEARLSPYAELVLKELGHGTVDWVPNFDGTIDEPKSLPARIPNIILNGTSGIAVGMATDIPPHNMKEVIEACCYLLDNPNASIEDLCEFIPGPDFPTDAWITTSKADIVKMYSQGVGSLRMRALYILEDNDIIITALPHMVSGSKILEQIAELMQAKKLPQVVDLRDESDHENPTRLVIVPRSAKTDIGPLMTHLFATTDLERSYRVNLNMIGLDGRPRVKPLDTILKEWLTYRLTTVTRRLQHRLEKVLRRMHLLEGFLVAFLNIDKIIEIIRETDSPRTILMSTYGLSDQQADAILDMKLRHLAKLEEMHIKREQDALSVENEHLTKVINSEKRLKSLIKKELQEDAKAFGDPRRSPLKECPQASALSEIEQIASEPVTVVLSQKGWIRQAKGHDVNPTTLNYKSGDGFHLQIKTMNDAPLVFMDSTGRAYTLYPHSFPSARSQGEPLTGRINSPDGASFDSLITGLDEDRYLLVSQSGYGFKVAFKELMAKNRNGKAIIKLSVGSKLLPTQKLEKDLVRLVLVSSDARLLIVDVGHLPELSKGKGSKLMSIVKGHCLVDAELITAKSEITLNCGRRKLKLTGKELSFYKDELGSRGHKLPAGFAKCEGLIR